MRKAKSEIESEVQLAVSLAAVKSRFLDHKVDLYRTVASHELQERMFSQGRVKSDGSCETYSKADMLQRWSDNHLCSLSHCHLNLSKFVSPLPVITVWLTLIVMRNFHDSKHTIRA